MDSGKPAGDGSHPLFRSTPEWNFAFAFNDCDFSDRVLRIEIIPDLPDSKCDSNGFPKIAAWACNPKLRREQIRTENDVKMELNEHILNTNIPDLNAAMIEKPTLSIETKSEIGDEDKGSDALGVKTIHVSSPILAAKSPFFFKLFKEFKQKEVSLRIHVSEDAVFMELLNFMYINSFSATSDILLLELLIAADIYEVDSCLRYCSRLLLDLPMSIESALLYLDLPLRVLNVDVVQPLIDAAKKFILNSYKDLTKYQEEALDLSLAGIEAVLESDDLEVTSEDAVFDFMLKWARLHYPEVEERRKIIETHLAKLVRFPYMTSKKLRNITSLNDFDHDLAIKFALEAVCFKSETPSLVPKEASASCRRFVARAYKYRPVTVVVFGLPELAAVVYLDLKQEECMSLFPSGRIYSQAFYLLGQGFFLSAHCTMDPQNSSYCFGLFLGMQEGGTGSFSVDYEFASKSKSKPSQEYTSKFKGTYTFTGGKVIGYRNLFGIPWTAFVADDSPFFINGILHLKAQLIIRH